MPAGLLRVTITLLLAGLALLGVAFSAVLVRAALLRGQARPTAESIGLGAVTNFFDTLGIGSFAPTTAWIKFRRLVPDTFIPATLNVGHALPTIVQSAIFLVLLGVHVDPWLLGSCIAASVAGALIGAPLVIRAPVRIVRLVVGIALLIAALLFALRNLELMPEGGLAQSLGNPEFGIAVGVHFLLGALMAFGIGLYAPSLILLSLLGLDPRLAFPIMASACAYLMPMTGFRFARAERIDFRIVIGIALGGIPAVLAAAFVVKEMPMVALRWCVVVVVLFASFLLLRSAFRDGPARTGGSP
jgi:uncharacterized membrane protein YfcA